MIKAKLNHYITWNNEGKIKPKLILGLIFFFIALSAYSQNDFNVQFAIPAGNFNRLSVCGDAQTHNVRLENISGEVITDGTLKMDLPIGMIYVPGSLTGGVTEVSLSPPTFNIGDFAAGEVLNFSYDIDVTCDGLALAQSSASVNYLFDLCYTGADGEQNNIGAPKFEVVNPTLSFPTIVGNESSSNLFDGAFDLTDTLKVHLVNGGEGNLRELTYCVKNNHPNLTLNSILINGTQVPVSSTSITGDSLYFIFDADEFAQAQTFAGNDIQDPDLFQFNELLIVCEVWKVTNCPDPELVIPDIERIAFYGCDGVTACQQTATTYTGVRFGILGPNIQAAEYFHHFNHEVAYRDRPYYTDCYDDEANDLTYAFAIINRGDANMKVDEFDLTVHAHNYYYIPWALDESSVNFYFKDGATQTPVAGPTFTNTVELGDILSPTHTYITNCHEGDATAVWRLEYRDANLIVAPGDTLMIEYDIYHDEDECGGCSDAFSQFSFPYPQIQNIEYSDECEIVDFASVNSGVAPRLRNYTRTFAEGTNNFFSNAVNTTCWNVTVMENYFINYSCPGNGQPQVGNSYDSDRYHINSPNAYLEDWYILPEAIDWVGTSGDLNTDCLTWIDATGDSYPIYELEYTDHDCGPDTLKVRYQGSQSICFSPNQSKFTIKTTPDCGEAKEAFCSKTINISKQTYYVTECDVDGTKCFEEIDVPRPHTATIHGCECNPCEGMVFTYLNLSRQTFGENDPDNDGIIEPGILDTALVNTGRFITGDTIRATYGGWVNLIDKPNFEYAYATINVPIIGSGVNALGDDGITPLSAQVQIWDRSTGLKYDCDLVQLFPDGQKVVANISTQSLIDLGCSGMPLDFVYEQGDSIAVDFNFRLKDYTTTQQSVNFGSEFYLTDEPYDTGTHYQCNTLNQTMTYIPWRAYNEWVYREIGGCNDAMDNNYNGNSYGPIASVYDSHRNLFRLGSTGFDYFPNEVRQLAKITKQTYINKSDLEWGNVFRLLIYDNNGHLTETGGSLSWQRYTLDMTTSSCFAISGNMLVVDFECIYAEVGYERFDEGMDIYASPALSPTCNSEYEDGGTYKDIEVYTDYDMLESMFCSPTWTAIDTSIGVNEGVIDPFNQSLEPHFMHHRNSIYSGDYIKLTELPRISLQPLSVNQVLYEEEACFRVDVANTGSGPGNNVFFTLENNSGAVVFQGVKDAVTGVDLPVNLGVVNLGTMDVGEVRELEFCVTSNNCDRDSILINTGWDCTGLPTSPQEANCTDPVSVYLEIPEAELSMVVLSPDPAVPYFMDLCTEVEHVIQLSSSNVGSIHDINFQFTVPPGMDYVPGSFQLAYPVPAGGSPTWVTTGNQPTNTTGNQYNLVLDPENPILADNGLPGTTDIGNNFLLVRFNVFVGCGSYSGSRVRFLSWAYDSCDEFVNYRFNPGPVIKINGVADSYVSALSVPEDEILNACEGNSVELGVNFSLAQGSLPIGPTDSVMVVLPEGIKYVPNSYTINMNGEPPSSTNPTVINNGGSETVFFDLLDGVTAGNAIDFTFEVAAEDVAQTCREYEMIIRTFNSQGVFCDATGEFCDVKTTSDEVSASIEIIKPDLSVSNLEISSCAAPPDMEELSYCFDLTNTEASIAEGTTTVIEFYDDSNDNGDFNNGVDVFLASVTITDAVPMGATINVCDKVLVPSGMTCDVIAVINPESTCACDLGTSYRAHADLDLKLTTDEWIVCSDDPITDIGPAALDNVTYEWVGINGASTVGFNSTTATPTDFQFQNTTGSTIVWEYYLRAISNNDCASLDTIQITIYPEEHGEVSLQACPFDEFNLAGPEGNSSYQWTPSAGLSNPNAANTDVDASFYPEGLHNFVLNYTDENGCPGDYTAEVTIVKCALTYVGNYVWCDDNNNGIQDDLPAEGFTVQLFGSTDPTMPIATTTTDVNGAYLFGPIPQGEYIIGIDLLGSNYQTAMKNATTDDLDNDLNPNFQTDPFYLSNGDSLTTIDLGILCPEVDIELTKTALTNKETNVAEAVLVGDTVYWTIQVCNRMMEPDTVNFRADSIQVIDQLPTSLTYINYTASQGSYDPVTGLWDVGNINNGSCPSLCITTIVAEDVLPICNVAEVSRVTDPEIDSSPANDDGDQSEDDEGKAYIYEKRMDLALTKEISTAQMLPVEAGNDVTFTLEVCNQGNVAAYNVQLVDYIPMGMTLNDSDWTQGGLPTEAFISLAGPIEINECEQVDITLKIDPSFPGDTLTNFSEISHQEYDDGLFAPDIDSDTDDDPGNDGPVSDQETMNADGDQDDHDPAGIHIEMFECIADNNGPVCPGTSVTLMEVGGAAVSWNWSGPGGFTATVQNPIVSQALPGTYSVSVVDVNGFMETCTTELVLLPGLEINGTTSPVSCNGGSDGSIDINVSGGTAPYSYDWDNDGPENPDNDNQDISNVGTGDYSITVSDVFGCSAVATFSVTEPSSITCGAVSKDVLCNGGNTGTITASAAGGTTSYEFSINGGPWQTGALFSSLVAGTYNVAVQDANNCVAICQVNVGEPTSLSCQTQSTDLTDCEVQDGRIMITGNGGTSPYTYSINGSAFSSGSDFTGLIAGTHVVTIKDVNGCTNTCEATLLAPSMPMCTVSSFQHITCNGASTGSLTVTPSGGTAPYEYSLDNMIYQSAGTFNGLSAGLYQIYIRNTTSTMCVAMCSMELLEPTVLTCSMTHTDVSCQDGSDGSISVIANGGVTPYEYSIDGGAWQPGSVFNGLIAGLHTVTVRDANGCITSCSQILMQPSALTCTIAGTDVTCNGTSTGSISVFVSGGVPTYEYNINNGPWQVSNQFENLPAGTQVVSVRDANDCISTCSITLLEPMVLTCTLGGTDVTDCSVQDGTISALGMGGSSPYSYSIDGGMAQSNPLFENLTAGTHTVQVTDANGCTSICEMTLSAPMVPGCQITDFENISCSNGNDGSIRLAGFGGTAPYEYSLDNISYQSSNTFTGLTAGIHTIYVRNSSSPMCISTCSRELTEPTELICQHSKTDVSCNSGDDASISVNATGGVTPYEYSLNGGAWQPGFEFENLEAGAYAVIVRDANDCTSLCQVIINEPSAVSCSIVSSDAFCKDSATGMLVVSATGGVGNFEYSIDNGPWQISNQFTMLAAGSYTVTTRDENFCTSQCVTSISEPAVLSCELSGTDVTNCEVEDGTINVSVMGGTAPYVYAINGGSSQNSATFTDLISGGHTVIVTDVNGCETNCSLTLTVPAAPTCQITSFEHIDCKNEATGSITVIGSGENPPYEYSMDNSNFQSSGTFSGLSAGVQVIYVRNVDSPACISMCSMELLEPTLLVCDHVQTDVTCKDGSDGRVVINATGGETVYEYSLDGSPWQPSNIFNNLSAGSYTATVRDANDCLTTCMFTILEPTQLVCNLTKTDVICNGDGSGSIMTTASGGVLPYEYSLDNGPYQSGGAFANVAGGMHSVTIRDAHNCLATCSITVAEPIALTCSIEYVINESCAFNDGEISINPDGGVLPYTFSIDGGIVYQSEMIFSGLTHGIYTIEMLDGNGCSTECEVTVLPDCFDLALEKSLVTDPPYEYGQYVVFEIQVENQGNIDATDVEITEHIPCGFTYEPGRLINLANDWSPLATSFPMTMIEDLDQGEIVSLEIELKVEECITPNGYLNVAEISSAEDDNGDEIDDVDSDPDYNPDNDPESEDDHDTELLPIYDPSLIKVLATSPPFNYGDILEFTIKICNQNSNEITNVSIVDYMPSGYSFDPGLNTGWSLMVGNTLSYLYDSTVLNGGDCVDVPLFLKLEMSAGHNAWRNVAEINSFTDENANPQSDTDAENDADPGNDGTMEDNLADNTNDDEDDSDFENIEVVDLALAKTTTAIGPFHYGDAISFDVELINQGNGDAYNILVNDFIPCGYMYSSVNDLDWSYSPGTGIASTSYAGPLAAGTSVTINLILEVQACADAPEEAWLNISEIQTFEDENGQPCPDKDIDSTPDNDPENDTIEDDIVDNSGGDEDDHDMEEIRVFDLAQIKKIVTPMPYAYSDLIEYSICVVNQGNVSASNVTITDYLPEGLGFDSAQNSGWTESVTDIIDYNISGPLASGDTICIPVFLEIDMTMGGGNDHTNVSEITSAIDENGDAGEDADSTADNDPDNDGTVDDDSYHDEQDDHDIADLMVVDVALIKTTTTLSPYAYGDQITFDIEVFNQGNIDLYNIVVNDFIPCGYTYLPVNDSVWSYDGLGIATTTISGVLAAGSSETVSILLELRECVTKDAWRNISEVESFEDVDGGDLTDSDVDSDSDNDPTNDGDMEDDETSGENGDEDDSDFETIMVYDLAQIKKLVSTGPFEYGDVLEYEICVVNQGNVDAEFIELTDHLPEGLSFASANNSGWDEVNAPIYTYEIINTLAASDTICISIFATLEMTAGGSGNYSNISEISADDGDDADSEGDDDPDNDGEVDDDSYHDEQDDHDIETLEVFDLALRKTIYNQEDPTSFQEGDQIQFLIEVFNQGNVDAYNIKVCDHIPAGFTYDPSQNINWTGVAPTPNTICTTIEGPVEPGYNFQLGVILEINNLGLAANYDDYTNYAEITSSENEEGEPIEDMDSDADNDPTNDDSMDDAIDNENDEDDHDLALPQFMDLALKKELAFEYTTVLPGDIIAYNLTVYNQGTIDAYNVELIEYSPPGLILSGTDGNGWSGLGPNYTNLIPGPIALGDSVVVQIEMEVQAFMNEGDYVNSAEISGQEDVNGNTPLDFDSTPDNDNSNDGDVTDNAIDGENGDEDDSDHEALVVVDLALIKTVKNSLPVNVGDDVCFTIEVFNQGNIPVSNVLVNDYIPSGFLLSANDLNGWISQGASLAINTIVGPISPLSSETIEILLTVQAGANLATLQNVAEIGGAQDSSGTDISDYDVDSDPDDNPENDGIMKDDVIDGTNDDEDDSDLAYPPVFDLSLIKTTTNTTPVIPGNVISYMIEICNQGNIAGQNILITDYPEEGLSLATSDMNGWTQNADGSLSLLYTGVIGPDKCETVEISMEVLPIANADNTMNFAEIESSEDDLGNDTTSEDIDSDADGDEGNDDYTSDDDHSSTDGDEDDHDGELLPVFDLALRKFVDNLGPYALGEKAQFDLEICNQGNIIAQNVEVVDYIPTGLAFATDGSNAAWTLINPSLARTNYSGQIAPGTCVEIPIWLTTQSANPNSLVNMAEISGAQDDGGVDRRNDDIDSHTDQDNTNDNGNDLFSNLNDFNNQSSYAGGDEDDHDQAWIVVCVEVICEGHLNVSLDQFCSGVITPAMMLDLDLPGTSYDAFEMVITDLQGNVVDHIFDGDDIGKTFNVQLTLPGCSGGTCTGTIAVEDKFAPILMCNSGPFDVPCYGVDQVPPPTATENCGDYTILLIDEDEEMFDCETYAGRVTRTYVGVDASGNQSIKPCIQVINIIKTDFSAISIAEPMVHINCSEVIAFDANGNPAPWVEPSSGSGTGVPILCVPGYGYGVDCVLGTGTGDGYFLIPGPQGDLCNTTVTYEDTPIPTNDCGYKFMRRFSVTEYSCGTASTWMGTQTIKVIDDQAPIITCPDNFTVSTGAECSSVVQLPPAVATDICGSVVNVKVQVAGNGMGFPGVFIDSNGGSVTLPVGEHMISYIAYDGCFNSSTCTMVVAVEDSRDPVALCQQDIVVSLPASGTVDVWAQSFDDGSSDECGISKYEVTRMVSTCNPDDEMVWDDVVSFCCDDLLQDVMVILRVWDNNGNYNQCMINVAVQDKTTPVLNCPADLSEPCTTSYDLNNLSATFGSPSVDDNCSLNSISETVTVDVASCGTGTITRDFVVSDFDGNVVATCTQVVTLTQVDPMTEADINWPDNIDLFDICDVSGAHPNLLPVNAAYPEVMEGVCDLVGHNYEDEVYSNVSGAGSCHKILRHWEIINWCQTDEDGNLLIWEWTQVIQILNTMDPIITGNCPKLTFTSTDVNCGPVDIILTNDASDDCSSSADLTWTWSIDIYSDNNGVNDVNGTSADASGSYPIGLHTITWTVEDECGNIDFCVQEFEIINIKTPIALCISGLSSELIPMDLDGDGNADTELVVVSSNMFDAGSIHSCGYAVDVSFSADVNDDLMTFGCTQVGTQPITLWVTDTNGNTAICTTFIIITNNVDEGLCNGLMAMVEVEGRVVTAQDNEVDEVMIQLSGSNLMEMTGDDGDYAFDEMMMGGNYAVVPSKNDDVLNGVSTLDIIHIQRHILGLEELSSPYQFIAADANKSGTISAIDLVQVRKVILGLSDAFQNNKSWRFIDGNFEFDKEVDPLSQNFPEKYEISNLSADMKADFIGVKIADVNGTAKVGGFQSGQVETRSKQRLDISGRASINQIDFLTSFDKSLRGFQMTITFDNSSMKVTGLRSSVLELDANSYHINNEKGFVTLSWHNSKVLDFRDNEVLFSLVAEGQLDEETIEISSSFTRAEAYDEDFRIMEIDYRPYSMLVKNILHQNEPNPWISSTTIKFDLAEENDIQIIFRDAQGKLLKQIDMDGMKGTNIIEVNADELNATGMLFYEMIVGEERISRKMILLD